MKRTTIILAVSFIALVMAALAPLAIGLAQDGEITLAGLAERLATVEIRMDQKTAIFGRRGVQLTRMAERVATVESRIDQGALIPDQAHEKLTDLAGRVATVEVRIANNTSLSGLRGIQLYNVDERVSALEEKLIQTLTAHHTPGSPPRRPTFTPSPTKTPTITPTPIPGTPTPTATPIPATATPLPLYPIGDIYYRSLLLTVETLGNVYMYTGPGENYSTVGIIHTGSEVKVDGIDPTGHWLIVSKRQFQFVDPHRAWWIQRALVRVKIEEILPTLRYSGPVPDEEE